MNSIPQEHDFSDATAIRSYPVLLRRMQRLLEVGHTLASTLDLPYLLQKIIVAAMELTESEAASIMLIDPTTGELRFEATTSMDSSTLEKIVVPKTGSFAGWIVTNAKPDIIHDVRQDPRFYGKVDSETTFDTRSIMGAPLISQKNPIGVLQSLNKKGDKRFGGEELEMLQALAAHAAIAIVNARLFQQSDLIAEMVHELRTPLTALTATAYILKRPDLPAERSAEFVDTMLHETSRLTAMTNDFLDLARLESGRAHYIRESFAINDLARECVGVVRPQADDSNVTIQLNIPADFPEVDGDRDKIKQVILNLLTNAVKYNREGGQIHLSVAHDESTRRARISVQDSGVGISPKALPHIGEKFYRVPDSEGYAAGTGLGLAIAFRIVETHGSEMEIESELGVGTTFSFTLAYPHVPGISTRS